MRTDLLMEECDKYAPKLIYLTPNFNNPTGYYMSNNKRRRELLNIAQSYNALVIEDDPWSDISFQNNRVKLLKSFDEYDHVIYIKGFSKLIGAGYRIAALNGQWFY